MGECFFNVDLTKAMYALSFSWAGQNCVSTSGSENDQKMMCSKIVHDNHFT